jgi:hypothetical protein
VSRRSSRLALLLFLGAALLRPGGGRAHTPITTNILFNREVVRILKDNCLGCHRKGGIAPMSLASYEEARPWAKAIKEELLERRMPPWPAVKGYGSFANAPLLSQGDVDKIVNWVEGGAPRGDPALLPPGPLFSDDWPLGPPDVQLAPDAPQEVAAEADERVELRWTLVPGERWLSAFDVKPGTRAVVHCAALFLRGTRPALLGTWVPGYQPSRLPEGVARRLPAQATLLLRLHYKGAGEAMSDRSVLGLYFNERRPARELRELALRRSGESTRLGAAADAIAIVPRQDPRVASLQATAYRPDGTSEVLVWVREPKADWQQTLVFKKPVALPRGTRIEVIAHPADAGLAPPLATLFYAAPSARPAASPGS